MLWAELNDRIALALLGFASAMGPAALRLSDGRCRPAGGCHKPCGLPYAGRQPLGPAPAHRLLN